MNSYRSRGGMFLALAAALLAVSVRPAAAQTYFWTGASGANGNWSDPANWFSFAQPPAGDPASDVRFLGAGPLVVTQDIDNAPNGLVLNSLFFGSGAGAYTISGQPLNFVANGATPPTLTQNSPATQTANCPLYLSNTLTYMGDGSAVLGGRISGAAGAGLTKTGTGTLTLAGMNTFGGPTIISGGKIILGHIQALQNSTVDLQVNNGLDLGGLANAHMGGLSGTGALDLGGTLIVGGNHADTTFSGALSGSTGALGKVGSGTLTLTRGGTLRGVNCFSGTLAISGATLTLTGSSTDVSGLGVSASALGVVRVENGGRVVLGPDTVNFVNGPQGSGVTVTGAGSALTAGVRSRIILANNGSAVAFTITDGGSVACDTLNNGYGANSSGTVTVSNGGSLTCNTFVNGLFGFGTVNVTSGGTLTTGATAFGELPLATGVAAVNGANSRWVMADLTLGGLNGALNGGTGRLRVEGGGAVTVAGTTTLWTPDSSLTVRDGTVTTGLLASAGAVGLISLSDPAGGAVLTVNAAGGVGTYSGAITGVGSLVKTGGSLQILAGANSFSGPTTIRGGRILLGHPLALQNSTADLRVDNGLDTGGLSAATLGGLAGTGALNLWATELTVGGSGADTTFSGALGGTTGGLTKEGAGTLTLTRGGTLSNARSNHGILAVSGPTADLTLISTTTDGKSALLAGRRDVTHPGLIRVENGGRLALGPGASAVLDGPAGTGLTVTGAGSVLDAPSSSFFVLGNSAGLTGALTVADGGSVVTGNFFNGLRGSGSASVTGGGSLITAVTAFGLLSGATGEGTVGGADSRWALTQLGLGGLNTSQNGGTGRLKVDGGGTVTVAGTTTLWTPGSSVTVDGGTLTTGLLASAGTAGAISLTDSPGGRALTVNGASGTAAYGGTITGTGSLLKSGGSTQTLAGNNSYTGPTTVGGGTLILTGNNSSASYTAEAGGTLVVGFGGIGASSVRANLGGTVRYITPAITGGSLGGAGTHIIDAAVQGFSGTTIGSDVSLSLFSPLTLNQVTNSGSVTVSHATLLAINGGVQTSDGRLMVDGTATVSNFVGQGRIRINPGGTLTNTGSAGMELRTGSQTFVGSPAAPGGVLEVGSQPLLLAGGVLVNNGVVGNGSGTGRVVVDAGGLATGAGYYDRAPWTQNGGSFSPGNGPGQAQVGDFEFNPGGIYVFEINNAAGTAGPAGSSKLPGWDLTLVRDRGEPALSALVVTATQAEPFTFHVVTQTDPDVAGAMTGFDPTRPYRWLAFDVDPQGKVTNWDPTAVVIDTGKVSNEFAGGFELVWDAADPSHVYLTYTPVPEPGHLLLACAVSAAAVSWWRRCGAGRRGRQLSLTARGAGS